MKKLRFEWYKVIQKSSPKFLFNIDRSTYCGGIYIHLFGYGLFITTMEGQ
jgi:hypothetical protein